MKKKKNGIKLLIASVMVALVAIAAIWGMGFVYNRVSEPRMIYLYPNTSPEAFADTLRNNLGKPGEKAWTLMKLLGVDLNKRVGAYRRNSTPHTQRSADTREIYVQQCTHRGAVCRASVGALADFEGRDAATAWR